MTKTIGANPFRTDGHAKVTGEALYIDDLDLGEGFLWGMTIRSTEPRAKLVEIVYDGEYDWSGITRVDHRTIARRGWKNCIFLMEEDQPALAEGEIRHMYEPVVLLACADIERLEEAAAHVTIVTEALPPVLSVQDAKTGVRIYGEDNLLSRLKIDKGDVDAAFETADLIIEGDYYTGWQEQMYIETQGMAARPLPGGGVWVCGSLQCPYYVVKAFKHLFGFPEEKIQVVQAVTGGGFGGKEEYPSMIAAHVSFLALESGKTVKIVYDRGEDVAATTKRHPAYIHHKTGLLSDGTIVAQEVAADFDGGAYVTLSPVVLSRGLIHAAGAYRCEHVRIEGQMWATNTPPNGAFRGFGNPQVIFAAERHMDRLAEAVGMTPLAFRRHNMLLLGDTTATGQTLSESVGGTECLDTVLERSDYDGLCQRVDAFNARAAAEGSPTRRGVGLSFFFHGAGFTGNGEAWLKGKADVELTERGGLRIYTSSTDIGQGTLTIFPQLAAQEADVPFELVEMAPHDTLSVPDSGPTVASRTTMVVGKVVQEATRKLVARVAQASGGKGISEAVPGLRDHPEWPFRTQHTYETQEGTQWDADAYVGDAYPCFGWAADVAVVEVDLDTYETKILEFHTAEDVGKALHPRMVEGQIEGGTLQGIGYAYLEEVKMEGGAVLNNRMTNCIIPTALDAPEIYAYVVEEPYSFGPHGAKGVGELPLDGAAPAVAAAVEHATGVHVDSAPFTPEMLAARMAGARE
jgi:CO/xanthine dehydrogenase Mo-binding subunit